MTRSRPEAESPGGHWEMRWPEAARSRPEAESPADLRERYRPAGTRTTPKNLDVHIEVFEGPLDLLLFLIKKDDLDIRDIPLARITGEYLDYLRMMRDLDLDVAGEFLATAAQLVAIKTKSLLPQTPEADDELEEFRSDLSARLLEYERFKRASGRLEERGESFKDVFYRGAPRFEDGEKTLSIGIFDLLGALKSVLERSEASAMEVAGEEFPIEDKMAKIQHLLERRDAASWEDVFAGETRRRGILTCFIALLELVRLQKIFIRQEINFGKIMIFRREVRSHEHADAGSSNGLAGPPDR